MTSPDDLPPHPDDYRDADGLTDYARWQAALAEWRGADTKATPPEGDAADRETSPGGSDSPV